MYPEAEAYLALPLLATYPHEYSTWEQFWEYIVCTCKKDIFPPLFWGVCWGRGSYNSIWTPEHAQNSNLIFWPAGPNIY